MSLEMYVYIHAYIVLFTYKNEKLIVSNMDPCML